MKEVKDFFNIYQTAAWNKDAAAIVELYDEQAVIFDTWDRGYISSRQEWVKIHEDWLGSLGDEKVKVGFENINIQQSRELAFASALISYQAIAPDRTVLRGMKNRFSLGFIQSENGWKVMHHHMSAPVSSDGLTAILDIE